MKQTLSLSQYILVGSMLFGMFFGAGNLIFPVHLGQEAGANVVPANIGFMLTAIGLPFLGIIAMGVSRSKGLFDLAGRINTTYAHFITILLYLSIGPAFALPRTAAVSFEIGFASHLDSSLQTVCLAAFTVIFFLLALFFALKPGKIIIWIGKFLNPLFLIFLAVLIIAAFINPMGAPSAMPVQSAYQQEALTKGIIEGYNTMDALASLAFGIIVIHTLSDLGLKNPKDIALGTLKAGIVVLVLMGIIYSSLSYIGATSLGQLALSANGGIALADISTYYFGSFGHILLAGTVTVACLKTAIGLITACSTTFSELYPHTLSYKSYVYLITFVSFLISNVGLTSIIYLAIPILMLLYPLAITLILLAFIDAVCGYHRYIYLCTTVFTLLAAIGDMLGALPFGLNEIAAISSIIEIYRNTLPFFDIGMGWIVPAVIGIALGTVLTFITRK
ncbi:branched-chain amino acid transport system II carrier protein [Megamonas hypermegale]|uniref:branched-chain amino acid transport system II carrier protein n=1 Tax=Megamonas hypermegale TaxID=158847 RepID=UPI0025A3514A|nr:branched-chain amino acid transport system II carrier protein [Megamonas hypermegale]MDM8142361.1 branched-chain amino acid transport system II carrier protein [Megamonas hypermegale]